MKCSTSYKTRCVIGDLTPRNEDFSLFALAQLFAAGIYTMLASSERVPVSARHRPAFTSFVSSNRLSPTARRRRSPCPRPRASDHALRLTLRHITLSTPSSITDSAVISTSSGSTVTRGVTVWSGITGTVCSFIVTSPGAMCITCDSFSFASSSSPMYITGDPFSIVGCSSPHSLCCSCPDSMLWLPCPLLCCSCPDSMLWLPCPLLCSSCSVLCPPCPSSVLRRSCPSAGILRRACPSTAAVLVVMPLGNR